MAQTSQWTWLIYMAGDNNLEGRGREDLGKMKQVGSTPNVKVIVQFDTKKNETTRYLVEKNNAKVVEQLPGVDCGDPKVLTQFIQWGTKNYPAQHYLLDVWSHGGGWENPPSNSYDAFGLVKPLTAPKSPRLKSALFRTTVEKYYTNPATQPYIALDVSSHDYLDTQELRSGVLEALAGGRKLDIFGCDACLMNMLEIAYEMKDTSNFMVGSEETVPGRGWPYAAILNGLVDEPTMTPADLAKTIVTEYGKYYEKAEETATQSALDLNQIQSAAAAVNELANALLVDLGNVAKAVSEARDHAQKFTEPKYVDVGDLADQLIKRLPQNAKVESAAKNILKALSPTAKNSFVIQNAKWGLKVQRASGVSIYFPSQGDDYARDYRHLALSKEGNWVKFLEALFEV
jgi:hypothetical protein